MDLRYVFHCLLGPLEVHEKFRVDGGEISKVKSFFLLTFFFDVPHSVYHSKIQLQDRGHGYSWEGSWCPISMKFETWYLTLLFPASSLPLSHYPYTSELAYMNLYSRLQTRKLNNSLIQLELSLDRH